MEDTTSQSLLAYLFVIRRLLCNGCYDVSCVEMLVYFHLDVIVDQSVELLCNTSLTSNIMWTYDTKDGYVNYLYWNGRHKPWLAVKSTAKDHHSLLISDAQLNDSGLYDCYDEQGTRKVGYQLVVAGMRSI